MSRIWDALQKVEELRDASGNTAVALPERIRLTPKQRVAIQALLRTSSIAEAAEATGVTEMTMRRWLGRPGFVAEYYQAGRKDIEDALARLDRATESAVAVLEQAQDMLGKVARRAERDRSDEGDHRRKAS